MRRFVPARVRVRAAAGRVRVREIRPPWSAWNILGVICIAASMVVVANLGTRSDAEPVAGASRGGNGTVHSWTYTSSSGTNPYLVYTPPSYRSGDSWPLYVNLHGCSTTAEQQMYSTGLNEVADSEQFLVVYPDVHEATAGGCWRAFFGDPASGQRGAGGDADIVAAITRATMERYTVDPERVYLMGMSSGGFQASAGGAAYSDLYAAIGVSAGGGYGMNVSCAALTDDVVPLYAREAVAQMRSAARVMPFFAIGGTVDPLGEQSAPGGCSRLAFAQWMATDNLIASAAGADVSYQLDPNATVHGAIPDGYNWTKQVFGNRAGCRIGERWIVDGMGHFWSGGSSDPQWSRWSDLRGPDASAASWDFFRRFTKSGGPGRGCAGE